MVPLVVPVFLLTALSVTLPTRADGGTVRAALESRYSRAHSLGNSYIFDPQDGWQSVNVTNLPYKYRASHHEGDDLDSLKDSTLQGRAPKSRPPSLSGLEDAVDKTFKVIGAVVDVVITWRVWRVRCQSLLTKVCFQVYRW
jgi:hypothetical protein